MTRCAEKELNPPLAASRHLRYCRVHTQCSVINFRQIFLRRARTGGFVPHAVKHNYCQGGVNLIHWQDDRLTNYSKNPGNHSCWDGEMCACVFFSFFLCRGPPAFKNDTQGNQSLLCHLKKPGHYSAYWYSIRVHILRPLLCCIPVLCTDVTIFTHNDNNKIQHNKGQHKSTRHKSSTKEQSEGRRSISRIRVRVFSQRGRLSCGVCGGRIPRGERGCDAVEEAHRSQSPPRRRQMP